MLPAPRPQPVARSAARTVLLLAVAAASLATPCASAWAQEPDQEPEQAQGPEAGQDFAPPPVPTTVDANADRALQADADARDDAAAAAPGGVTSIGTCHDGALPGGVELPRQSSAMRRLGVVAERGTGFGTPRLVAFVLRTASRLAALPEHAGVPLRVGNLSVQGGGTMRWSHSHRAGRDVDFPLFVLDGRGKPASVDGFVVLDDHGHGRYKRKPYRFDAPRTWNLVATLISDPRVDVARLYLSASLTRLVLQHAEESGADAALVERARVMLEEPSHAGRHDDHLHVRIFCAEFEIGSGCVDEDDRWPWSRDVSTAVRARVDGASARLAAAQPNVRIAALDELAPWRSLDREACTALTWAAAWDDKPKVRERAVAILQQGRVPCATELLLGAAKAQTKRTLMEPLLRLAVSVADDDDGERLVGLLSDRPEGFRVPLTSTLRSEIRSRAARRLALVPHPSAAAALSGVLRDPRPGSRRAARVALEVLANQRFAGLDHARAWWRGQAAVQPLRWLVDGFLRMGLPATSTASELVPGLLELLRGPDLVLARNAERALEILSGGQRLAHADTPRHRHRAWARFWAHFGDQHAQQRLSEAEIRTSQARAARAALAAASQPSAGASRAGGASDAGPAAAATLGFLMPSQRAD